MSEKAGENTAFSPRPFGSADAPRTCAVCGSSIDTEAWHPVATNWNEEGAFHVFAFCDGACRDAWTDR